MYTTTGIIQGNTVLIDDSLIKHYNGKKVIVTVLEDDKHYDTITDEKLFAISDSLIDKNIEAYKELAKWFLGIHLTLLFLKINNVQLNYVQQELIDLGFGIASSKLQKNDIRKWFENHVVGQY